MRITQEEFVRRSASMHGYRYFYEKTAYTLSKNKVTVICPEHGDFEITASKHLMGRGCRKCSAHKGGMRSTKEDFRGRSVIIHDNMYDYSKVVYTTNRKKVEIICPNHGSFWQTPSNHLKGHGCGECYNDVRGWISEPVVKRSGNSNRESYLYILEAEEGGESFYKFGVCYKNNIHPRLYVLSDHYDFKLIHLLEDTIEECLKFEKVLKEACQNYKPSKYFKGHTECFKVGETT